MRQNRPIPHWVRMRTGNTIRWGFTVVHFITFLGCSRAFLALSVNLHSFLWHKVYVICCYLAPHEWQMCFLMRRYRPRCLHDINSWYNLNLLGKNELHKYAAATQWQLIKCRFRKWEVQEKGVDCPSYLRPTSLTLQKDCISEKWSSVPTPTVPVPMLWLVFANVRLRTWGEDGTCQSSSSINVLITWSPCGLRGNISV
jgi:hypothetical protein